MSVDNNHWINGLTPDEERQADTLELIIMHLNDQIAIERKEHNRLRHLGTGRMRRRKNKC